MVLWRKVWRDLKENKGAYTACVVVMAIGLMIFTSMSMVMENLQRAKDDFYREYRFADGFARVRGMPASEVEGLARLEGIALIQGRLVKDVRVLMPGNEENISLRLVSIDTSKSHPINNAKLIEGRPLDGKERTIWLSPAFFAANKLKLGDRIPVIVEGRKVELTIAGLGQSPEFVYAQRTAQEIFPDPHTFGIAYVSLDVMKTLFREQGLINDLVFLLEPGTSYKMTEDLLKPKLAKYGLESIYPGKDQASNAILTQELDGLRAQIKIMPVMFLLVAAIILYIMLKRLVEQQRGQIGTLKAFGYSGREILTHYLSYALITGFLGGLTGGLLGIGLSYPLTDMYRAFYELPNLSGRFALEPMVFGILLSVGFSLFAGYQGSKGALGLIPAEAMRPPAPLSGGKTPVEKFEFFWGNLTVQGKMATRNLFRNKQRSFFTFVGVLFTFFLMAMAWYFQQMSSNLIDEQFTRVQTFDVKMSFIKPLAGAKTERELSRIPGMKRVEVMAEIPATLKFKWHKKDVAIIGLRQDTLLYNIMDKDGNKVRPPARGILLSERLAETLGAGVGSKITLESPWAKESSLTLEVSGIIAQSLGVNAYMERNALNDLLGQGDISTSALLAMEQDAVPQLREKYTEAALVASMDERQKMVDKYKQLMDSYAFMNWIIVVFALIAGFAVVYNTSIISLAERKRELASLRVLGMTPREVLQVLTFEQWFISLAAMAAGIPFTYWMIGAVAKGVSNDMFSIPVYFTPLPNIQAFFGTVVAIAIAQWTLARKIHGLSLVEVLKERD